MKRIINISFAIVFVMALVLLTSNAASAQVKTAGQRGALFVDANGDGICDNVGTRAGQGMNKTTGGRGQGTGVCTGAGAGMGTGAGTGKGTGVCTGLGTGTGTGTGTGVCDGTGPKGAGRGRK